MNYFKRKISPSQSELLCSWDGKGVACEVRGRGFKSQRKNILSHFESLRYRLFYPVPKARAIGTTFGVPVQETGTKGQSQPVPMAMLTGWSRWSLQSVDETADSSSFPIHSSPGFRVIRSLHRGRINAKHLLILLITKVHHSLWFLFPRIPYNWQGYRQWLQWEIRRAVNNWFSGRWLY